MPTYQALKESSYVIKPGKIPVFKSIYEAIDTGLFDPSDVLIFWGKRGKGKSSLMTKFCVDYMQSKNNRQDVENSASICSQLREAGIANIIPPHDHLVFIDTFARSTKGNGRIETAAYETSLKYFGVPSDNFNPSLICPYGKYAFDETQKELDSHNGSLPVHTSSAFELSRHARLFIMLAMQRPMRAPKDIRDLATFVECVNQEQVYNDYGLLLKTVWTCNIIYNNGQLESYINSRDPNLIDLTVQFEFEGNIYECYDPYYHLPAFFKGMENEGLTLHRCEKTEFTKEHFDRYNQNHGIKEEEGGSNGDRKRTKRK